MSLKKLTSESFSSLKMNNGDYCEKKKKRQSVNQNEFNKLVEQDQDFTLHILFYIISV